MSSIKISQLPALPSIAANTSNTLFLGVDIPSGVTGKFTATTLAQQLYANNALTVGNNQILFSNTVSQFSGYDPTFLQINMQNFNGNGSADVVITGDKGTNSNNFIDMGLNGSNFQTNPTVGSAYLPNDGYIYVQGPGQNAVGNLLFATSSSNTRIMFSPGGLNKENIVAYMDATGLHAPSIDAEIAANVSYVLATANAEVTALTSTVSNVYTYSQSAYGLANTINGTVSNLSGNVNVLQSQLSSNAATIGSLQNTVNTLVISSNTANLAIQVQAAYNTANGAVQNTSNLTIQVQAAYNTANGAVQNTANIIIPGNVTFNGTTTHNGNIVTIGTMTTTGNVVTTGNLIANGTTTFNGNVTINGTTVNNGNTINYGNLTTTGTVTTTGNLIANGPTVFNGNFTNNGYTINNGTTYLNGNTTTTGTFIMTNSTFASNSYAVGIIGSASGQSQAPIADGTMLQITGKDGVNSKLIVDAAGSGVYALFNGRSMRGLANTPSALLSGDVMVKYGGNGYGSTGFGSGVNVGGAYMQYVAAENFSDTTKGTNIVFGATATGSNTVTTALTLSSNVATMNGSVVLVDGGLFQYSNAYGNATVTQSTNKSTAVTCNGRTGQITTSNATLNHGTCVTFTVNNNYIVSATDVVIVNIASGATSATYSICVTNVNASGSFDICLCNNNPGPGNAADTLVINFAIIRVA